MQILAQPNITLPPSYRKWWLCFRQATNEASLIARTVASLLRRVQLPGGNYNGWAMSDVGCGDGVLTAELVRLLSEQGRAPLRVDLIDPLLQSSSVNTFCRSLPSCVTRPWPEDLARFLHSKQGEHCLPSLSVFIHSPYYISNIEMEEMCLRRSPLGSLLVVNSLESFMGDTWALINRPMHQELIRVTSWLESECQLIARADGSLRLPLSDRAQFQYEILSFLAFQELSSIPDPAKRGLLEIVKRYRTSEESVRLGLDFFYVPPCN